MFTRKQYLNGEVSHDEYYLEIAKEIGIKPDEKTIEKVRNALRKGDKHLNTIPLYFWDMWAVSVYWYNREYVISIFTKRGDQFSQAGLVCALKAICRYYTKKSSKEV